MARKGASLVEVLVVIGLLAGLIGLLLPAIQQVRSAGVRVQSQNNLRQIILGVHQAADEKDGRISNLTRGRLLDKSLYSEQTLFRVILPYVVPGRPRTAPQTRDPQVGLAWAFPDVPAYRSPADPGYTGPQPVIDQGDPPHDRTSYACNMLAFDGAVSLPVSVPDGTSSTTAVAERYHVAWGRGIPGRTRRVRVMWDHIWGASNGTNGQRLLQGDRRASFADSGWDDVMPVTDPATKQTRASVAGMTFQVTPTVEDADPRVVQTPFPNGLPVALFDGSVRTLSPGVAEGVFWALVTPAAGDIVGDF